MAYKMFVDKPCKALKSTSALQHCMAGLNQKKHGKDLVKEKAVSEHGATLPPNATKWLVEQNFDTTNDNQPAKNWVYPIFRQTFSKEFGIPERDT